LARSTSTTRSTRLHRSTDRTGVLASVLLLLICAPAAHGADELLQVFVTEPYLELHTGPGRGYPVFHVVPRSESVDVVKRRTDWFQVRSERGVVGWASQTAMLKTALADGTPFQFDVGNRTGFTAHRWEVGMFAGDYGGATLVSIYGSYSLNPQLAAELSISQFLGNASNGVTYDLGLTHVFVPEWIASPFVTLGTGYVDVDPKATLVQPLDREDQSAYAGAGVRFYLARRFFLRAEYRAHVVFTSRDDNEEVDEWKAGFAFFF
jgi:hypothetical protein